MSKKEIAIQYALSFLGLPYRWGGDDPIHGFDCSGLVQEILASVGMDPPGDQTAHGLFQYFLTRNAGSAGSGALAFYGKADAITHIAMLINDTTIIEAGGGGSKTQNMQDAANQNAFVRLRPLKHRKDLVAVLLPNY
jgi:cell wall-associated NlpC family hydrolase